MSTQAYDKYQSGQTVAVKQLLRDPSVVSYPFTNFMQNFSTPESVDSSDLGTNKWAKLTFFETLMTGTFHVHWGAYNPPAMGPGNNILVQFRQNGSGGYTLTYAGFDNVQTYEIDTPDYFVLNSNSFELKEGLVGLNIKRLNSKSYNGENLWVHELVANGRLIARYYLVPYVLQV